MKEKMCKRVIAVIVSALLIMVSLLCVSASTNLIFNGRAAGHYTAKYDAIVSWQYYAEANHSQQPYTISSSRWESVSGTNGASATTTTYISNASWPRTATGYMSCKYFGDTVFTAKPIIVLRMNSLGHFYYDSRYGTVDWFQ